MTDHLSPAGRAAARRAIDAAISARLLKWKAEYIRATGQREGALKFAFDKTFGVGVWEEFVSNLYDELQEKAFKP